MSVRYIPHDAHQLSINEIDEIVDEVRKGKYSKNKPSVSKVLSTGLSSENIEMYVVSRWPELTRSGITMRTNKLTELITNYRMNHAIIKNLDNAVWKIQLPYFFSYKYEIPHIKLIGRYEDVKTTYEYMLKPFLGNESSKITFCCLASRESMRSLNDDFFSKIKESFSQIDKEIEFLKERKSLIEGLEFSLANSFDMT